MVHQTFITKWVWPRVDGWHIARQVDRGIPWAPLQHLRDEPVLYKPRLLTP